MSGLTGHDAEIGGHVGPKYAIGWNIPEERVKHYEEVIKNGGIVMGLRARNDEDAAHFEQSWKDSNGQHVFR